MDATRRRRLRDCARQTWYGRCRTARFARFLQFPTPPLTPCPKAKPRPLQGR
jgi:hypothetical protein